MSVPKRRLVSLLDTAPKKPLKPSEFTAADRALIRNVHAYMPGDTLLAALNERLLADRGGAAVPYTMEQLHDEIRDTPSTPKGGHDWATLRKLLASARKNGVLTGITRQVIDDFAVVYSLSSAQVVRLKDVILSRDEESL